MTTKNIEKLSPLNIWHATWTESTIKDTHLIIHFLETASQDDKNSLLGTAGAHNCLDTVKLLIENGAQLVDNPAYTVNAFQFACKYGNVDMINYFVSQNIDLKDFLNRGLIKAILGNDHDKLPVLQKLLDLGADIHYENDLAIHRAAYLNKIEIAKYLLANGADLHANDDIALVSASSSGNHNMVKLLLEHGANVHAQGEKSLAFAIMREDSNLKHLLIQNGADITNVPKLATNEPKKAVMSVNEKDLKKVNSFSKKLNKLLNANNYELDSISFPNQLDKSFNQFLNLSINSNQVKASVRRNDLKFLSRLTKKHTINLTMKKTYDSKFKEFLSIAVAPLEMSEQPKETTRLKI